jgi:thiol:disulfide interchange protein DsbC
MRYLGLAAVILGFASLSVSPVHAASPALTQSADDRLSLDELPLAGGVEWGSLDEPAVVIFTDYRCPFSRAMITQLTDLGAHVIEFPISILGSRDLANAVICAPDRVKAMRAAYGRVPLPSGTCDTASLDQNEAFAAKHGIAEVPVMVRSDGAVMRGYADPDRLADWLDAAPE